MTRRQMKSKTYIPGLLFLAERLLQINQVNVQPSTEIDKSVRLQTGREQTHVMKRHFGRVHEMQLEENKARIRFLFKVATKYRYKERITTSFVNIISKPALR